MILSSGESLIRDQPGISEVYSPPRVAPYCPQFNMNPGWSLDLTTQDSEGRPWDFDVESSRERAKELIRKTKPLLLIGSTMSTWFSTLTGLAKSRITAEELEANLQRARSHLQFTFELYDQQVREGRYFLHGHPKGASSWGEKCVIDTVARHEGLESVVSHMCAAGMTALSPDGVEGPVLNATRWLTNALLRRTPWASWCALAIMTMYTSSEEIERREPPSTRPCLAK